MSFFRDLNGCIISSFYIKPQHRVNTHEYSMVALYRLSTSNHNWSVANNGRERLHYIVFLHQTTTFAPRHAGQRRCIISSFYIKPQPKSDRLMVFQGCIISSFYIKPQRYEFLFQEFWSCIISSFYIKPQLG